MIATLPSSRRIIASLIFLLAGLVAFYGAAYLYRDFRYPRSVQLLQSDLGSPEVTRHFKVEEAKKSGYSDQEIAGHLASKNSATIDRYVDRLFFGELTVFLVAMLLSGGLMVLNARGGSGRK